MKNIKSVKLKNDYRTGYSYMEAGAPLVWETDDNKWLLKGIGRWNEREIINNKTDLFEVEYEEERKYIDVRITTPFSYHMPSAGNIQKTLRDNFHCPRLEVDLLVEGYL